MAQLPASARRSSNSIRERVTVADPRTSRRLVSVPPGETMTSVAISASSITSVSQPGRKPGGFCVPVRSWTRMDTAAALTPSAEIRPARISDGS